MRNKTSAFALTALALGALASPSYAINAGKLITGGGGIGFVILFLSVVGLALIIEHFINVRREKLAPPELIDELEQFFNEEQYQEALELCESEPNYLTNVLAAALPKMEHGFESMEQAAHDIAEEESIKLHSKVSWLSLLSAIAPMLGLLGTVWGMIGAFDVIAEAAAPEPSDFAGTISLALITTVLGLIVAIPMMTGFFYFRNKVTRIVLEIGAISEDLLDRFRR
ncbi:MAG: MotA/TolQ/ExbB proton channel family protein [Planctomycetes bacterium]|nr:MotA/TolQ/ExbB proton channel family protein [Planctomycetota bacterium]